MKKQKKPPDNRKWFVEKAKKKLDKIIGGLSEIKRCDEFVTKLKNAKPYLFTGVIHPEVPLHNNHAERMIRNIVIHRKLMGCIRNEKGERFIENVMSVIETWELQNDNLNLFKELRQFAN